MHVHAKPAPYRGTSAAIASKMYRRQGLIKNRVARIGKIWIALALLRLPFSYPVDIISLAWRNMTSEEVVPCK